MIGQTNLFDDVLKQDEICYCSSSIRRKERTIIKENFKGISV